MINFAMGHGSCRKHHYTLLRASFGAGISISIAILATRYPIQHYLYADLELKPALYTVCGLCAFTLHSWRLIDIFVGNEDSHMNTPSANSFLQYIMIPLLYFHHCIAICLDAV